MKYFLIRCLTEAIRIRVENEYQAAKEYMLSNPHDRNGLDLWLILDAKRQLLREIRGEL